MWLFYVFIIKQTNASLELKIIMPAKSTRTFGAEGTSPPVVRPDEVSIRNLRFQLCDHWNRCKNSEADSAPRQVSSLPWWATLGQDRVLQSNVQQVRSKMNFYQNSARFPLPERVLLPELKHTRDRARPRTSLDISSRFSEQHETRRKKA